MFVNVPVIMFKQNKNCSLSFEQDLQLIKMEIEIKCSSFIDISRKR